MITFKEYLEEGVLDATLIKKKPLNQRTSREQAFLNAQKASKPKTGKVVVHIKHEDGSISKSAFKLTRREQHWEDEAREVADSHLKNLQHTHDQFPNMSRPRAKEIHKVEIK